MIFRGATESNFVDFAQHRVEFLRALDDSVLPITTHYQSSHYSMFSQDTHFMLAFWSSKWRQQGQQKALFTWFCMCLFHPKGQLLQQKVLQWKDALFTDYLFYKSHAIPSVLHVNPYLTRYFC